MLTLEIGMVGRLIVVGIPFPTFKICPLVPLDVLIILSARIWGIWLLFVIVKGCPLQMFTTPFLILDSAIVTMFLMLGFELDILCPLIDILVPLICGDPLIIPFVIAVSLVLRFPLVIGSGSWGRLTCMIVLF